MKKFSLSALFSSVLFLAIPQFGLAVCPICTIAVGAGIGLSRWLGIDDTITGLWIGGLIVSLIFWTIKFLKKKNLSFKGEKIVVTLAYCLIIIVPLWLMGIIGHQFNRMLGIDKLVFGIVLGSVGFLAGALLYPKLKSLNNDKAHFPFEKIALPIIPLIILSFVFYFITKR